jgi:hypothetical protein
MSWASYHIEKLEAGQPGQFRPRRNLIKGKIDGFEGTMNFFTQSAGLPWIVGFAIIVIEKRLLKIV